MDSYIARQPIFDKSLKIFAYELLFRSSDKAAVFTGVDGDLASSHTIMESFHTMGVDTITGGKPAFINFTTALLQANVATLFPKNQLVIEVLEDVVPTPEVVAACEELVRLGYVLALDDFEYRPELIPLIRLSQIIKFDFLANSPREIYDMLMVMEISGKTLLAEKIETMEMFNMAGIMGFTLFQGYFFSKPVTLSSKSLTPLNLNYFALLSEVNAGPDMDFDNMSMIIRRDLALCHKLLRMVNSAYYGQQSEVTDIKRALAILGTKEIRKWIYLMTMMDLSADKPDELVRMSMIRGHFMEHMAHPCRLYMKPDEIFLTGMFSLIDVLMDQPMHVALAGMALTPEICKPLLEHEGQLYDLLQMVVSMEKGDWDETDRLAFRFNVSMQTVTEAYLSAIKKCNELFS